MARVNCQHIPGQIWHITHRCHKMEFLLKFVRDRKRWIQWLFEANKRYGLDILNYTVTSNHIHLAVVDGDKDVISKSIQLVAGKSAQEFKRRKERKGAFWEDRSHATAIEAGEHFLRCLVYIDLNTVRNGMVQHPSAWQHGGYNEIQNPPLRCALINREKRIACCGLQTDEQLRKSYRHWVEGSIHNSSNVREPRWTESIAVGSEGFVQGVLQKLGLTAKGRRIRKGDDHYELRKRGRLTASISLGKTGF